MTANVFSSTDYAVTVINLIKPFLICFYLYCLYNLFIYLFFELGIFETFISAK